MPDENVLRDPVAATRRALIAAQDPERLEAVRQTGLLDASLQPSLQRFARLLCELLDVPISLVSLLDAEREFFTARCGVAVEAIPLEASYAKHVVAGGKPLAVADATRDAGLADLAAVRELGFGAYLGAPVHAGGHCVGAPCVVLRK